MKWWIFLILACAYLHSEERFIWSNSETLAVTEGDASAVVAGCVNVLGGDFFVSTTDLVVEGVEPIRIPRFYVSGNNKSNENAGWSLFPQTHLIHHYHSKKRHVNELYVSDSNGSRFKYTKAEGKHLYHINLRKDGHGVTNTSSQMGARTNLKNATVRKEHKWFIVTCPDGTQRGYEFLSEQKKHAESKHWYAIYLLWWEKLPSGNYLHYGYDSDHRVTDIWTSNPSHNKIYNWIKVHYACEKNTNSGKDDRNFWIETSDGRRLDYIFYAHSQKATSYDEYEYFYLLNRVLSTHNPAEEITYSPGQKIPGKQDHYGARVNQINLPDNRFLIPKYYRIGANNFDGSNIHHDDHHSNNNRLMILQAPVGADKSPISIYRFSYNTRKDSPPHLRYESVVYDHEWNETRYIASDEKRIQQIVRLKNAPCGKVPYNTTDFFWGTDNEQGRGDLRTKVLRDENNIPLIARTFSYDVHGNVLAETIYGNLTGSSKSSLIIQNTGAVVNNGVDKAVTIYSYNAQNLPIEKREEGGCITRFSYLGTTPLPTRKAIYDGDHLVEEEILSYNSDNIVIRSEKKSGPNHTIRLITPRNAQPALGLPGIIEERYIEEGVEKLLRKVVYHYNRLCKIIQEDVYDSQNTLCYSLYKTYNEKGQLLSETDPLGRLRSFTYDANGNQITLSDPIGTTVNTYDFSNRLVQATFTAKDGATRTTLNHYDYAHNRTGTIDYQGSETRFLYNSLNQQIGIHHLPTATTTSCTYDAAGNKISSTDPLGYTTYTTYNARGKPIHIAHPDNTEEQYFYNLDGTLASSFDQNGTEVRHTYDSLGNLLSKTVLSENIPLSTETYTYNGSFLLSKSDSAGNTNMYTYDGAGRKISECNPFETTAYSYDPLGRLHTILKNNILQIKHYDLLDRVVEEITQDSTGAILDRIAYTYDDAGNIYETTRWINDIPSTTQILYDSFKRPILHVDPLGHITRISYNDKARQKITTDPKGIFTIETFDTLDHLVLWEKKNPFGDLLAKEEFFYDALGNKTKQVTTVCAPNSIPRTVTTLWEYGTHKRLCTLIEAANTPEQRTTRYTYNAKGLVHTIEKPDRTLLTHTYDPLGRLTDLISSDKTIHYRFTYNALHQVVSAEDFIAKTTTFRTYDQNGNLLSETFDHGATVENNYDAFGRKISFTLPDHSSIHYHYDDAHLISVERCNSSGTPLYTHHYTAFDHNNRLLEQQLSGNLGTIVSTYDLLGRATSITSSHHSASHDTFDAAGNVTASTLNGISTTYTYDDLSQLSSDSSHTYMHDSLNNRLAKNDTIYTPNSLNQLPDHFTYDANGNPISHGRTQYTYDALDRLLSIERGNILLRFTYDVFHRRTSKTLYMRTDRWIPAYTQHYLYDRSNEIGDTSLSELRILGLGRGGDSAAAIAIELSGVPYIPLHDLRGNIVQLRTLSGSLFESYTFTPFGEETSDRSPKNPWRFCSKRVDSETHLVFFGRRYYDPALGRWLTPDPRGFDDGMNVYAFLANNPLLKLDLYGLMGIGQNNSFAIKVDIRDIYNFAVNVIQAIGSAFIFAGTHILPDTYGGLFFQGLGYLFRDGTLRRGPQDTSQCITVGEHRLPSTRVTSTLGILTDAEEAEDTFRGISQTHGGIQVHGVHNSTHGFMGDCFESLLGLMGFATTPARMLATTWREQIEEMGGIEGGGTILHYAHSEGGIITERALKMLPPDMRKMIQVKTFGSASLFNRELAGDVTHYVSKRDGISRLSTFGYLKALMGGGSGHVAFLEGNPNVLPLCDHSIMGQTYWGQMIRSGGDFKDKYGL